ncbi:MAG: hypothetical protein GJ680_18410 [Alteromonadaceae bacterium]|nr:hypothetical protein [Alteromonadaceae bacterium]
MLQQSTNQQISNLILPMDASLVYSVQCDCNTFSFESKPVSTPVMQQVINLLPKASLRTSPLRQNTVNIVQGRWASFETA